MRQYFNVLEKTYKQLVGTISNGEIAVVNYNGNFISKICIDDSGLFLVLHHITDSDYSKYSIINDVLVGEISIYIYKKSYLHNFNQTDSNFLHNFNQTDSNLNNYFCKFSEN